MGLQRHISGSLKQSNKKHKKGKKRHDSQAALKHVSVKCTKNKSKRMRKEVSKQRRISKAKMISINQKNSSKVIMCLLLPMHAGVDPELAQLLLSKADPRSVVRSCSSNILLKRGHKIRYLYSPALKREFALVSGYHNNFSCNLDLARLADWVIFILPGDCRMFEIGRHSELLSALYAQGLPSSLFCVLSNVSDTKEWLSLLESKFAVSDGKVRTLNSTMDASSLLRHLSQSQKKPAFYTANNYLESPNALKVGVSATRLRSGLLAEGLDIEIPEDGGDDVYLKLEGVTRGWDFPLFDPSQSFLSENAGPTGCPFVHITGWGDFPVKSATWRDYSVGGLKPCKVSTTENSWVSMSGPDEGLATTLSAAWDKIQLNSTDDNELEESDIEESGDNESEGAMSVDDASDIHELSPDDDDDDDEFGDSDTTVTGSISKPSVTFQSQDNVHKMPSKKLTTSTERVKAARIEQEFPDEVETPPNISAKRRFAKFRGLPSFSKCSWPKENDTFLPYEYGKIFRFHNYTHNRRTIVKHMLMQLRQLTTKSLLNPTNNTPAPYIPSGSHVLLTVGPMAKGLAESLIGIHASHGALMSDMLAPLTVWSLLPYERCLSVLHATMQKRIIDDEIEHNEHGDVIDSNPIMSKEPMVFQIGIRRFIANPIYSQASKTANTNAKAEKFFTLRSSPIIATMYAPVMYAPLPVLQFRVHPTEELQMHKLSLGNLVAVGSIMSIDPSRAIIKRILLSGHPYKINKRSAVVRYMFHTPEDIEYFKPIQLHTKSGAVGHIKQSVGTHGLMKCAFDRQLLASDVVLMPLYKRIFPKMTYDCQVTPKVDTSYAILAAAAHETDTKPIVRGILKSSAGSFEVNLLTPDEEALFK